MPLGPLAVSGGNRGPRDIAMRDAHLPAGTPVVSHSANTSPSTSPQTVGEPSHPLAGSTTGLDALETSRVESPASDLSEVVLHGQQVASGFRHGFWAVRRVATRRALVAAGQSGPQIDRFDACGAKAWLMRADDNSGRVRLACNRCHHRWCEACQVERRRIVVRNLIAGLGQKPDIQVRFLTLTLKSSDAPLGDQIDRLYASWVRLRNGGKVGDCIDGSITFFEVTYNPKTNQWHPHLHAMVAGRYIPKEVLSREWLRITGDSYIVDIRAIRNVQMAAGYVAKYASKAIGGSVWRDESRAVEAITALASRRLVNTHGCFREMNLTRTPADDCGWLPIMPLHEAIARAERGDADAMDLLRALRRHDVTDLPQSEDSLGP